MRGYYRSCILINAYYGHDEHSADFMCKAPANLSFQAVSYQCMHGYQISRSSSLLAGLLFPSTVCVNRNDNLTQASKSAKANGSRPGCPLSQIQKLCKATLAARRA